MKTTEKWFLISETALKRLEAFAEDVIPCEDEPDTLGDIIAECRKATAKLREERQEAVAALPGPKPKGKKTKLLPALRDTGS